MRPISVLAAAVTLAAVACAPAGAQTRLVEVNPERSITVTGEASVEAAPDTANVTLGVKTTDKDASAAMAANASATTALIAALKQAGVAAADIQTSSLSVAPAFSRPESGGSAPPTIVGYNVSNMVMVTVRDLSRLGTLIDRTVKSGANAMYGVAFDVSNSNALLDKARPLAFADARRKAEIYATAAGAKLGRVTELSEQVGGASTPFPRGVLASAMRAAETPIETGQTKLTVTTNVRFELTE